MGVTRPVTRSITSAVTRGALPGFSPRSLFAAGEQGAWYDPSDLSSLFQDSAGTTPVTAVSQPVGLMKDKSGRGNHASQATTTARPLLQQDSGGRYYLQFDGTDDSLATGNINFTGTDKVGVFAGLRKLSDASIGIVAELSTSSTSSNGAFAIFAPNSNGGSGAFFRSRGTATADADSTGYAAPSTFVLCGQGDIPGDLSILRRNGIEEKRTTTDQGTGKYGNYPLYIGARGGSSLPFNGRMYGLVVRGAASTAAQITSVERYLAARSGVTL